MNTVREVQQIPCLLVDTAVLPTLDLSKFIFYKMKSQTDYLI